MILGVAAPGPAAGACQRPHSDPSNASFPWTWADGGQLRFVLLALLGLLVVLAWGSLRRRDRGGE
jgi:hypothetical protein